MALKLDVFFDRAFLLQADKEFVWSLWKELQKQSPDLTAAMDLVIAR